MSEDWLDGIIFNLAHDLAKDIARADSPPNALVCNPQTLEVLGVYEEITIGSYKLKVIPEKFAPPGIIYLISHPYLMPPETAGEDEELAYHAAVHNLHQEAAAS